MHRDHAEVVPFVVVNNASRQLNLPALAIDHGVRRGDVLLKGGRVGDKFED